MLSTEMIISFMDFSLNYVENLISQTTMETIWSLKFSY